jgi:hypothetical protein
LVVVVSADVAGDITSNSNFLGYARLLKNKGLLQQVVVDKCHLLFTLRHWQENLLKVKNLQLLRGLLVMLIATLLLVQETQLEASMLVQNVMYI